MWFRINYTIPGERTMYPLMEKIMAEDEKTAPTYYTAHYPSHVIHSIQMLWCVSRG